MQNYTRSHMMPHGHVLQTAPASKKIILLRWSRWIQALPDPAGLHIKTALAGRLPGHIQAGLCWRKSCGLLSQSRMLSDVKWCWMHICNVRQSSAILNSKKMWCRDAGRETEYVLVCVCVCVSSALEWIICADALKILQAASWLTWKVC